MILLLFYHAVDEFSRAENIVHENVIEEFYVSSLFLQIVNHEKWKNVACIRN